MVAGRPVVCETTNRLLRGACDALVQPDDLVVLQQVVELVELLAGSRRVQEFEPDDGTRQELTLPERMRPLLRLVAEGSRTAVRRPCRGVNEEPSAAVGRFGHAPIIARASAEVSGKCPRGTSALKGFEPRRREKGPVSRAFFEVGRTGLEPVTSCLSS